MTVGDKIVMVVGILAVAIPLMWLQERVWPRIKWRLLAWWDNVK